MPSAARNEARAPAGRAASVARPACTAARNASASTQHRRPSARTYPPGPVRISVRSPSARRSRLTRTSMFPGGSAGGSSGHSAPAIRSFETRVPRRSASRRSSRRASLPPNSRSAISWPSRSTANRPSSLILVTAAPPDGLPPGACRADDPCSPGRWLAGDSPRPVPSGDDRHGGFTARRAAGERPGLPSSCNARFLCVRGAGCAGCSGQRTLPDTRLPGAAGIGVSPQALGPSGAHVRDQGPARPVAGKRCHVAITAPRRGAPG